MMMIIIRTYLARFVRTFMESVGDMRGMMIFELGRIKGVLVVGVGLLLESRNRVDWSGVGRWHMDSN